MHCQGELLLVSINIRFREYNELHMKMDQTEANREVHLVLSKVPSRDLSPTWVRFSTLMTPI